MQTHEKIELSDLLSKYGSTKDRGFQAKVQALEEFSRLSSSAREDFPKPGKFFKHQELTQRFLSHYDDILVLSETGTGKTCEIAGFMEMTRKAFLLPDPTIEQEGIAHFSKVFIVVKNSTLKKEMKNQLMCKCTGGVYINENILNAKGVTSQKKAVTSVLKNAGYVVITYHKMAKYVYEKTKQTVGEDLPIDHPYVIREIQEIFNDSVIWLDEAHNLISDNDGGVVSKKSSLKKDQIYQGIHLILHKAQRIKRILSTATPMINETDEFSQLINLILPENGKIPSGFSYVGLNPYEREAFFPSIAKEPEDVFLSHSREELDRAFRGQFPRNYDFIGASLEQLEPWLRGKINYIRAADTGANPIYRGVNVNFIHEVGEKRYPSRAIVYPSIMSNFQFENYMNSVEADKNVRTVMNNQRQAENAVYPDGKWGSGTEEITEAAGLGGNIIMDVRKTGGEKLFFDGVGDNKRANDNFKRIMGDVRLGNVTQEDVLRNIGKYSAKYETICRNVLKAKGICFVYDELVAGSGLNYLAACLECLGCQRFEERTSIFVSSTGQSVKPLCGTSDQMGNRQIRETFTKASGDVPPRFAVLTQETAKNGDAMFEAINCKENMYGDYIKIILCSKIGREGININNVVEIDMVSSGWNESNNHQAKSRGIRATSHQDLLEELKKSGVSMTPTVDVMIYGHVALPPTSNLDTIYRRGILEPEDYYVRTLDGKTKLIVGINAYMTAEQKDISIKTVMRKLKQLSITCNIHYKRNVRDTDKDYTQTCDYDVCKYKCFDPPTDKADMISNNFDLLYSEDLIETAKLAILNFIKEVDHFSFQELVDGTYYPRPIHLMFALEEIIRERIEIIDRFGYVCFLVEDRGSFYVSRSYPDKKGDYGMYYYSQGLVAVEKQSLKEMNILNEQIASTEVITQLQIMDPDSPEFSLILHNLPNIVQVSVLEDAVIKYAKGEVNPYINKILNYFYSWFIYGFNRPETSLRETAREFSRIKSGRKAEGLKKIVNIFNKERSKTVIEEKNTPLVFVHILYGQGESMNKFSTISRFNKADGVLRILETDKMEVGWRFIDSNAERQVYNEMIQIRINEKKAPFEQYIVYGIVDPEGIFRIRDRARENNDTNDGRSFCRGIVCENYGTLSQTYELFYRVGYFPPNYDPYVDPNMIRAEVASGRRSDVWRNVDMSNDDLVKFVYSWERADGTKTRKCEGLQEFLYEKGLVMNVFPA